MCALRNWNLKTMRLMSWKCLIYKRLKLILWLTSVCQESLPIHEPVNLTHGPWLDWLLWHSVHKGDLSLTFSRCAGAVVCVSWNVVLLLLNKLEFWALRPPSVYLLFFRLTLHGVRSGIRRQPPPKNDDPWDWARCPLDLELSNFIPDLGRDSLSFWWVQVTPEQHRFEQRHSHLGCSRASYLFYPQLRLHVYGVPT